MRTLTLILVLLTLGVLIIYGCVIAAGGALGQPIIATGGSHPPESSPNMPVLPPPACRFQGQVVGSHVLLWVEDADPSEVLFCWLLTPEGRLVSALDRWPILIPALPGDWVLVVKRPNCQVCVHPYTITPEVEKKTTEGQVN